MKVQKSGELSAFGGINFVFEHLKSNEIGKVIEGSLPQVAKQSTYTWSDIFHSLLSIYMCGGDSIEDLGTHLAPHFKNNPFIKMPSPDTVLRRLTQIADDEKICKTERGTVKHKFNNNRFLEQLNIRILKKLKAFNHNDNVIDYDCTIIESEKKDCSMTYKRYMGYQPGVCTLNEENILFLENRGGNSDAKAFQHETLLRVFGLLKNNGIAKSAHFRADAASYQYRVVKLVEENVDNFYIGCRNSYVEKYFSQIDNWQKMYDENGEVMQVGQIRITPFSRQALKEQKQPKEYRLVVKRKIKQDKQMQLFTNDACEYRAILTNNEDLTAVEIANFYNHRGNMERQFDIMKNDFGWNKMPFSKMSSNTVFLYFMAICKNLYNNIINFFSRKVKGLKPTSRIKKFIFCFIILPAKWINRSRSKYLRVYGQLSFKT